VAATAHLELLEPLLPAQESLAVEAMAAAAQPQRHPQQVLVVQDSLLVLAVEAGRLLDTSTQHKPLS